MTQTNEIMKKYTLFGMVFHAIPYQSFCDFINVTYITQCVLVNQNVH